MSIAMTNTLQSPFHSPSNQVFPAFDREGFSQAYDSHGDYHDNYREDYQHDYQDDYQVDHQFNSGEAPHSHGQPLFGGVSDSQLNFDFDLTTDDYNTDILSYLDHRGPSSLPIQPRDEASPAPTSPASHPSPVPSSNPPAAECKYTLRATARSGLNIPQTWYDHDESGTYDPADERRRPAASKKRKLSTVNGKAEAINNSSEEGQKEPSLVVGFRFASWKARQVLQQCADSIPDADDDAYAHENGFLDGDEDDEGGASPSHASPSGHRHNRRQNQGQDQDFSTQLPAIPDPLGLVPDLRHHPAARGCKVCRANNTTCPLQLVDGSYPCTYCVMEDAHCELITPPTVKDACLRCQCLHRPCSYLDDGTAEGPCDECAEEWERERDGGHGKHGREPCLAGPAPGSVQRAWMELMPVQERKFKACTACRQVKKRCSLKSKTAPPPCRACRDAGIACTFTEICRTNKGKRAVRDDGGDGDDDDDDAAEETDDEDDGDEAVHRQHDNCAADASHSALSRLSLNPSTPPPGRPSQHQLPDPDSPAASRPPTPSFLMTDAHGHRGLTTTITTSFTHPVTFNHPPTPTHPCHFCASPAFALFGLGSRAVYAIAWGNGLGYTELIGGHGADGVEASRMCARCTGERAQVVLCPGHEFVAVEEKEGGGEGEGGLVEAMERLVEVAEEDAERERRRWCWVCFGLARWRCAVDQGGVPVEGGGGDGVDGEGCGLRLCERCVGWLVERFEGDLDRMVEVVQGGMEVGGKDARELIVRADVEFLRMDGLLMRNLTAMAGAEAEVGVQGKMEAGY